MTHCCESMTSYLREGDVAVRYAPAVREYSIPVLDGGTSGIVLEFCPWCGEKLPKSLRNQWFDELEAKGYDPQLFADNPALPKSYRTDRWWKEKGI